MASLIAADLVEEVRRRAELATVIGRRIVLRKEGADFTGPCPFCRDARGVLKVFTESRRWKCFSCKAGGDAFAFVQRADGVAFPVAVRSVAQTVGVSIPEPELTPEQKRLQADRAAIATPTRLAVEWWTQNLWGSGGEKARAFLAERGISVETARAFSLGYAPPGWHGVHHALTQQGASVRAMMRAGLLVDKGDVIAAYDRFRDRVMFPIAAPNGHVVGFGGRVLTFDPAERAGEKYVVGPATALFHPGRALFAIDKARSAIRSTRSVVLVEGYLDALTLHQVGVRHAVAVGADALTDEQVAVLVSCGAEKVVIMHDGGMDGGACPWAAAEPLLRARLEGVVAPLPSSGAGDVALFVRKSGREGVDAVLKTERPLTEWLLEAAIRTHCPGEVARASAEQRYRAVRSLLPYVIACGDGVLRNLLIKRLSRRFELDIGVLRAELANQEG